MIGLRPFNAIQGRLQQVESSQCFEGLNKSLSGVLQIQNCSFRPEILPDPLEFPNPTPFMSSRFASQTTEIRGSDLESKRLESKREPTIGVGFGIRKNQLRNASPQ